MLRTTALKIPSTAYLGVPKYPDLEVLKIVTSQAVYTCIFALRYIKLALVFQPINQSKLLKMKCL